jgi:hypothetical protein
VIHLEVMPDSACKACCVAQEAVHERRRPCNVAEKSSRRSGPHSCASQALTSGERVPLCSYCWEQEKRGETSHRQDWNRRLADAVSRVSERASQGVDPTEPLPLEYLQLSLGNKCNLACRMCNGSYSSRIAEDPVHATWSPRNDPRASLLGSGGILQRWGSRRPAPRARWSPGLPWFEQESSSAPSCWRAAPPKFVAARQPFLYESFARLVAIRATGREQPFDG